jgi:hypothetical protein
MNMKTLSLAGALLTAAALAPSLASASFVLDTGTPTSNTGAPVGTLSTANWVAAEFDVTTANEAINNLSVYLTEGSGNVNDTFAVDIYAAGSSFTGRANGRILETSATGTFTTNGWNNVALNWTPLAAGDYWVALQVTSTSQTKGLSLPGAGITTASAATPSGTAPALAFAYAAGANGQYAVESTSAPTSPFGVQLTQDAPVPLPAAAWLFVSGITGLGGMLRRRRNATA